MTTSGGREAERPSDVAGDSSREDFHLRIDGRAVRFALELALPTLLAGWTLADTMMSMLQPRLTDFADIYLQGRVILTQGWNHAYDPGSLALERAVVQPAASTWFRYNYTPFQAAISVPWALLPLVPASIWWSLAILVCLLASWWLLVREANERRRVLWLLVGASLPATQQLLRWQWEPFVIVLIPLSWHLERRGRPLLAGIALAGLLVKPQLAFLVPVALLGAARWRAVGAFTAASLVVSLALVSLMGLDQVKIWLTNVEAAGRDPASYYVEASSGLATALPGRARIPFLIGMAGVVGWVGWRWREREASAAYGAGILGSLIGAPFIHTADWVMAPIATGILLQREACGRAERRVAFWMYPASLLMIVGLNTALALLALVWVGMLLRDPNRAPLTGTSASESTSVEDGSSSLPLGLG